MPARARPGFGPAANVVILVGMKRDSLHEIIVNTNHQYVVWPARKPLPIGFRYVGKSGPKSELEFYLREMFVETMPVPMVVTDGRSPESRWG